MLRFPTLEQLYQANGTALGMEFVDEELLANESGSGSTQCFTMIIIIILFTKAFGNVLLYMIH